MDAKQTQELPERRPGEAAMGRDRGEERARRSRPGGTLAEPGRRETSLPACSVRLVRWLFFFAGSTEANPGSGLLGWIQQLFECSKDHLYVFTILHCLLFKLFQLQQDVFMG